MFGDWMGIPPEGPRENHRVTTSRRDLPLTGAPRSWHRMERDSCRKPQLACHGCLALSVLLCGSWLDTSLYHNKEKIPGPTIASKIASSPPTGRVTSQGRTIPRKAALIEVFSPLAPAEAPALMWVVDRGAPR